MTDVFVDASLGTGLDDGTSWANAFQTFETYRAAGLTADDRVYIMGGTTDVIGASVGKTIQFVTAFDTPVALIGVKSGTTNEPPQLADLISDRSDSDIPIIEVTGTNSATTLSILGYIFCYGVHFRSGRFFSIGTSSSIETQITMEECIINNSNQSSVGGISLGATASAAISPLIIWNNCEWRNGAAAVAANGAGVRGCKFVWNGGLYNDAQGSGGSTVLISAGASHSNLLWTGIDLSNASATTFFEDSDAGFGFDARLERCKIPSGFIGSGTTFVGNNVNIEFVACDNATDHTTAIPDYRKQTVTGLVEDETTVVRTGGGSDGDNSLSYKLTPRAAASTKKGIQPLYSPWMSIWVTTSDTSVTIYSLLQLASATRNHSEIFAEIIKPNEGVGTAGSNFEVATTRELPVGGTLTSVTTDSSTWGGGGSQSKFKHVFTISPEYSGPLMVRIGYAPESTDPLFVESKPDVG